MTAAETLKEIRELLENLEYEQETIIGGKITIPRGDEARKFERVFSLVKGWDVTMRTPLVDRVDQHAYDQVLKALEWWESPAPDHQQRQWIKDQLSGMLCPTYEHPVLKGLLYDIEHIEAECPCCGASKDKWSDLDYSAFGMFLKVAKWKIEQDANTKYQDRIKEAVKGA